MIVISEVRASNWMPFRGEFALAFNTQQIVGVLGAYAEEPGRSNRAGKTSFFEAILWCLYGKSRAKKEIELIHTGHDEVRVELILLDTATGATATVVRWRDAKNKGGLDLIGWEGQRKGATQTQIDALIGMNHDEFVQTAYFRQNDIDQFMVAGPQERKSILMRWVQNTDWSTHHAVSLAYLGRLTSERVRLSGMLESANRKEVMNKEAMLAKAHEYEEHKRVLQEDAKRVSDSVIAHNVKAAALRECAAKLQEARNLTARADELRSSRSDSAARKRTFKELEEFLFDNPEVTDDRLQEATEKKENAQRIRTETLVQCRRVENERQTLKQTHTGLCPLLKESCDRIKFTPEMMEARDTEIATLKAKVQKADAAIERHSNYIALHAQCAAASAKLRVLKEQAKAAAALEETIAATEQRRMALMKEIPSDYKDKLAAIHQGLEGLGEEAKEIERQLTDVDRMRGTLVAEFNASQEAAQYRGALQASVEELDVRITDANYVAYMFGPNGIQSVELENSFGRIEAEANLVLERLAAPFTLEFQAMRELGDWEANCLACGHVYERGARKHECPACTTPRDKKRKDELSLRVLENGEEKQFYMDSGGGKLLLSVGIRIALARLAQMHSGSKWGVLFLDEVFGSLDAVNRQSMITLITRTLVKELGFAQVFIISHEPEIRDALPDVLQVQRTAEGYSQLAWQ